MKEHRHSGRRRGLVAAVLSAAAVAVALPISGALASGEADPTQAQDQSAPRDDSPRNHGDCPDKDGRGGSESGGSSESDTSVEL
jgi:hypothetical protein